MESDKLVIGEFIVKEIGDIYQLDLEEPIFLAEETIIVLITALPTIVSLFTAYVIYVRYLKQNDDQNLYRKQVKSTYIILAIVSWITLMSFIFNLYHYTNALEYYNTHEISVEEVFNRRIEDKGYIKIHNSVIHSSVPYENIRVSESTYLKLDKSDKIFSYYVIK